MSRGNFVAGTSCVKKEATHERLDMPEMFLRVALGLNLHEQVQAMPRYHAEAALLLHPKNSKALYRRGLAGLGCGLLQQAKEDLREAAKLEPRNADIRRHLQECQQRMTEEKSSTKAYGGFLVRSQDS